MSIKFHQFWLKVTAVVIGSFAPILFLGSLEASAEPARLTLDLLSWPIDGAQSFQEPTTRFLSALTGGFLLGWGVLVWCLSGAAYRAAPEAIRRSVLTGLLAWFVLDTAGSIASGNSSNAFFNVAILLIAVGPLWHAASPSTAP